MSRRGSAVPAVPDLAGRRERADILSGEEAGLGGDLRITLLLGSNACRALPFRVKV